MCMCEKVKDVALREQDPEKQAKLREKPVFLPSSFSDMKKEAERTGIVQ